ncbi:Hdr-like menaquinol oxidoreductase cytochrome b-like subunit [Candidatus Magnetomoraceae bacterium gMMP-15]
MNVNYLYSLIAVVVLFVLSWAGVDWLGLRVLFGIFIPYVAFLIFVVGVVYRVMDWARSPVPFRIPSTCGQEKSLPWIKQNKIDNPSNTVGVVIRMILEVVVFRSLFRNLKTELHNGRLAYEWEKWLWLGALAFHWSFFVVVIRHLRFFMEPVPTCLQWLESLDGILQVGLPVVMLSGVVLLAAVTYLFIRRVVIPQLKYISLPADFFPLFLIMGIAGSGILMRYFMKVDIVSVKELTMGLATFSPTIPEGIGTIFYVHLFFVSILLAYFPLSKLMHMGGVFLSPTRNLANNNRAVRHINPWNYPVRVHSYEEYEDEFREKMKEAGLPVDKE